jgi:hypothetical protein
MNRLALVLLAAMGTAPVIAMDLPWQEQPAEQHPQYCRGFVVSGLDSKLVSGGSRTDLWLGWNYLIREGAAPQGSPADDYQAGRAAFNQAADTEAANALVRNAYGDCGLGRSGHQVTGW